MSTTANSHSAATGPGDGVAGAAAPSSLVSLKTLAPGYLETQHGTYVRRLEAAIEDPKNLNIALTGPYGTGKSSVLDEFAAQRKDSTLRLAISTLGPDPDERSLTNRIQKELVKQLIYSASANTLRNSRFRRITPTPLKVAVGESAASVAVLGALLALLGWLPTVAWADDAHAWPVRALVWGVVFALVVAVVTTIRQVTVNRFFLSHLSAAGASVTLSEQTPTPFDENLDVIVRFFDEESKHIVILEDLDRFNDPHIFEALRELNTLLNNTPARLKNGRPLRFVYAMKDSLFERLGDDTKQEGRDVAAAETIRANRTKFFDIVIPVVPFISHRNARELLTELLAEANITSIDRHLVELVARHATDMRLLVNMRNEYLVFAERLLDVSNPAPGLTESHLFALVAYKNFHLEDFEKISRRSSDLDALYDARRTMVRHCVSLRERTKRDLLDAIARPPSIASIAKRMTDRLYGVGVIERDRVGSSNYRVGFQVGPTWYTRAEATTPEFWDAVIEHRAVVLGATPDPQRSGYQQLATLSQDHLEALFPEMLTGRWQERNEAAVRAEVAQLDQDVDRLRGADFQDLVETAKFTMPGTDEGEAEVNFAKFVDDTLKSNLARDLVKHGYIDRNFTLYAAQFYGDFSGVDVATFIVQTVQTNTMDIDYRFKDDVAVANLLTEAGADFTSSVSAYNVQVLDYLLSNEHEGTDDVVDHIVTYFGEEAAEFLAAYMASGRCGPQLAARLSSQPWREVFTYVVTDENVPDLVRVDLFDAALLAAGPATAYDLPVEVGDFIAGAYLNMAAFTAPHNLTALHPVVSILEGANTVLPGLVGVDKRMRELVVERNLYELNAANLREALGAPGAVDLDVVRENPIVYQNCLDNLDAYLDAIEHDEQTPYSVLTPGTLADVLNSEAAEHGGMDSINRMLALASPDSSLPLLTAAPTWIWENLATAKLFDASLANIEAYRAHVGKIDKGLGGLLLAAGSIATDDPSEVPEGGPNEQVAEVAGTTETADKVAAAVAILNARSAIPDPEDRVHLVRTLPFDDPLPVDEIKPEPSGLFARLLEARLVADDTTTFTHLHAGGWLAVGPALIQSNEVKQFLAPAHVEGMVHELFESPEISEKVGHLVLAELEAFVADTDTDALVSAGRFAVQTGSALPLAQIKRIASASSDQPTLALELLGIVAPGSEAAQEIIAVLGELDAPYSHFLTRTQTEFEIPEDDTHKSVLAPLTSAGICTTRKKRARPRLIVNLG